MDKSWHLRPFRPSDLELAARLKASDLREIDALGPAWDAHTAIEVSVTASDIADAIEWDGALVGAWGLALDDAFRARIWLVTSIEATRRPRQLLELGRHLVALGLSVIGHSLYNYVQAENFESRRLVRALGFREGASFLVPATGATFIRIERAKYVH